MALANGLKNREAASLLEDFTDVIATPYFVVERMVWAEYVVLQQSPR